MGVLNLFITNCKLGQAQMDSDKHLPVKNIHNTGNILQVKSVTQVMSAAANSDNSPINVV